MLKHSVKVVSGSLTLLSLLNGQATEDCWAVRFGSFNRRPLASEEAGVIGVKSGADGNMYEVRYLNSQNPSGGFVCSRFDSPGHKAWETNYSQTNGAYVFVADFTPGTAGSLLVVATASTNFSGEHVEVMVMQFDAGGNRTWLSRFNSRGFQHRLLVNSVGDTFVTGINFEASVNAIPIATRPSPLMLTKVDANGDGLWCTHTNSVWPHALVPYSLALGPGGDLYAAWSTNHEWSIAEPYDHEFVTARLNGDGLEQWRRRYGRFNLSEPYSLLVDNEGNAFTTGSIFYGAPYDTHFTIKYSATGSEHWVINWPEDSDAQELGAAALDDGGNFFITLALPRWSERALVTAKFDPDGNRLWKIYENAPADDHYWKLNLRIDATQAVLVSGVHFDSTNGYSRTTITYLQNTTPGLPVIRREPASRRIRAGTTVTLDAFATGMEPLAYRWRLNGANIPGATDAALVLSDIQTNQSGSYSVMVTNAAGCALSSPAALTVVEIPPFSLSRPTFTRTVWQESDGSWTTNEWVQVILSGGRVGWLYTMEVSSNLWHWQPYVSRGVEADGTGLFLFRRETREATFFRASTQP